MPRHQQLKTLARHFGIELLAYILNLPPNAIAAATNGEIELEETELLATVLGTLEEMRVRAAYEGVPPALMASWLTPNQAGHHLFSAWRLEAGGQLPDFRTGDLVVDALAPFMAESYPFFLMLASMKERPPLPGQLLLPHGFLVGSNRSFHEAIFNDESLVDLFPDREGDAVQTQSYISSSLRSGSGLQLALMPSVLIQSAYVLMRLRGELDPSAFQGALVETLRLIRSAARGDETPVPAFVGFNHVAVPDHTTTTLPWGSIRPFSAIGPELIPAEAHPATAGDPTPLGFLLETTYPYRIEISNFQAAMDAATTTTLLTSFPPGSQAAAEQLELRTNQTMLTVSLAIERRPPVACAHSWTLIFDPLSHGPSVGFNPRAYPPFDPYKIRGDSLEKLTEWAGLIGQIDLSKIRVAYGRLISALSRRNDPVDGFIDCVIGWETLFGSAEGELSFRISSAMASLLHPAGNARLEAQKQYRDRYNRRSRVVHGSMELSVEAATTERDAASEALLLCLRTLIRDYPAYVPDADRARRIILEL